VCKLSSLSAIHVSITNIRLPTLLQDWRLMLSRWATDGSQGAAAREALSLGGEPAQLTALISQWAAGDFSALPPIELLEGLKLPEAARAYEISAGTIYLNGDWVVTAGEAFVVAVLTEELGHWLDSQIRSTDTRCDEGVLLARLMVGPEHSPEEESSLRSEDDRIQIILASGQVLLAEASAYELLTNVAHRENFWSLFETAFGTHYDEIAAERLRSQWQAVDFRDLPQIEVVSSQVLGSANGAYASRTNRVYLSNQFVASANSPNLIAVLLGEYGHYVDAQVNVVDTPGDKDKRFALALSLNASSYPNANDADLLLAGKAVISVEQAALPIRPASPGRTSGE